MLTENLRKVRLVAAALTLWTGVFGCKSNDSSAATKLDLANGVVTLEQARDAGRTATTDGRVHVWVVKRGTGNHAVGARDRVSFEYWVWGEPFVNRPDMTEAPRKGALDLGTLPQAWRAAIVGERIGAQLQLWFDREDFATVLPQLLPADAAEAERVVVRMTLTEIRDSPVPAKLSDQERTPPDQSVAFDAESRVVFRNDPDGSKHTERNEWYRAAGHMSGWDAQGELVYTTTWSPMPRSFAVQRLPEPIRQLVQTMSSGEEARLWLKYPMLIPGGRNPVTVVDVQVQSAIPKPKIVYDLDHDEASHARKPSADKPAE